jgi:hypothetical protein
MILTHGWYIDTHHKILALAVRMISPTILEDAVGIDVSSLEKVATHLVPV